MTMDPVFAKVMPPGTLRVAWLVSTLALRRKVNRLAAAFTGKRRPTLGRSASAPKSRGGGVLLAILSLLVLLQGTMTSISLVRQLTATAERRSDAASGVATVNAWTKRWIEFGEQRRSYETRSSSSRADWRAQLDRAFADEARAYEGIRDEEMIRQRVVELRARFDAYGSNGFRRSTGGTWYHGAESAQMLLPLALIGLLLAISVTLLGIAGPDQELAKVDSSFEWWFTFPVAARGLLLARVFETGLANPLSWFLLGPFLSVVFWCAGYSWLGIPMGVAATVYVGLLAGSLRVVAETGLRRFFSLRAVARLQALALLVAYPTLVVVLAAVSPDWLETLGGVARRVPRWVLINPLNPVGMAARGAGALVVALSSATFAVGAVLSCTALGGHLIRDGLAKTTGVEGVGRRRATPIGGGTTMGLLRKELTMLRRDRNLFVQAIALPAMLFGLQLLLHRSLLAALAANAHHAAAASFGVGAFVLATGACNTLALDLPILWIYFTVPRPLERLLVDKALFWAGVATLLALGTFSSLTWAHPAAIVAGVPSLILAIAGIVLNAFIATGIGVLGTDPLETEPRRRVQVAMLYLYMMIAGMFAYALYAPSRWAKFAQVVLSTLLAFALWQKVRDQAPYLLDPAEAPAPSVAVADGVIAALAFFVLQGALALLLSSFGYSPGAGLLFAFVGAGLVVTVCTVFIFWRSHLPNLASQLGLRPASLRWSRSAASGVAAGLAAATVARGYNVAIGHVEFLRRLRDEAISLTSEDRSPGTFLWIALLAIVAAPLFEEFIFRAVLYGGFRRSLGPAHAAVASALVFAIVHPAIAAFPVFVLGLVAAWSFERSRFLLAPILAHMTYNAAIVVGWVFR